MLKEQKDRLGQFRFIEYQAALGEKKQAITALLPLVQDDDSNVRSGAAFALGQIGKGEPEVITALLPLVQDDDSYVGYVAAEALGQIGKGEPEVITLMENWLLQHQDTKYLGNGIDVLWNLVNNLDCCDLI